jgi:two-component system heavy metal sensor histidine kinase CusS
MSSNDAAETVPAETVRQPWSLAARLTAWYAASTFLLIVGVTAFLYWVLISNLDREDNEFLADKIHVLRKLLHDRPDGISSLTRKAAEEQAAQRYTQVFIRIVDDRGQVILDTPGMDPDLHASLFHNPAATDAEPGAAREFETPSGKTFLIMPALARAGRSGEQTYTIHLAFDRTAEEQLLAGYRRGLWLVLAIGLVVSAFVGYRIARHGLRPVAEITGAARRIRSTTLNERIQASRFPAELSTLAATFNEMLDRLEESFQRLARFSADIAHELRTPVNNLRGEAEVALGKERTQEEYREVLGSGLEECLRLSRLIDSLLFLARAESPQSQITVETIDLGRELTVVRDFYEAAAGEKGIKLNLAAADAIQVRADRTLVQRAVGNLLANAIAHTGRGGTIALAAKEQNDSVCIEVSDTGSGIPPEHLPHVFDRFYRVDRARSNSGGRVGLGLAIVKSIAHLHGGDVAIDSEIGKGTRVILRLPRLRESNLPASFSGS